MAEEKKLSVLRDYFEMIHREGAKCVALKRLKLHAAIELQNLELYCETIQHGVR